MTSPSEAHAHTLPSRAEVERLALLMEECAEVQQRCAKILRHGYTSYNPDDLGAGDNRHQLTKELGDLLYTMMMAMGAGDVQEEVVAVSAYQASHAKMRYLHFQTSDLLQQLQETIKEMALP